MRLQIGKRIAAAAWIGCLLGSWPLLGQQVRDDPARRIPALASAAKTGKALGVSPKAHECNHFGAISCGQTVNGSLSSADCDLDDGSFIDFWEFQGSSGQTVTVTMTSQQIDPFLFLFDPAPTEAARNDDINNTTTTARVTFKLDATGPWTIGANSAFPSETGSYSLTLTCTGGPIGGGVPAAPTNLRTTSVSETEVELAWNDNANNEIGYRIELREEGGVFEDIGAVGTNATSAVIEGLEPGTIYTFRVRARNAAGDSAYSNEVRVSTPGGDGVITSPFFPDFRFRVRIVQNATTIFQGRKESDCIPETLCVSGAVAGRSEVFLRIIGPRPNGFLWPTIVRFTPSRVEVDIQQISTGIVKTYVLEAVPPDSQELTGLQDRQGFLPAQ